MESDNKTDEFLNEFAHLLSKYNVSFRASGWSDDSGSILEAIIAKIGETEIAWAHRDEIVVSADNVFDYERD